MRLVTYNIQFSRGRDGRCDLARIAASVRDADLIALQEVERNWPRSAMQDQPAELAALLPHHFMVYAPVFDVHGGGPPGENRRRQFGNALFSRWPILATRGLVLPKKHYPQAFNMYQGAQQGVIDTPCGVLALWNVHLGYLDSDERLAQLAELDRVCVREAGEGGAWSGPGQLFGSGPDDWSCGEAPAPAPAHTVWLGDFNSEPDSPEYRYVSSRGLHDAAAYADELQGYTHTRLYSDPPLRRRLDYCFVGAQLRELQCGYRVDREAQGSDHQPVWVEIA